MRPDDPRHGTTAGHYQHRKDGETACLPCIAAKTRYEKIRHVYGDRMVPALGTRRRIRALKAIGHSGADIGARLGVTYQAVHKLEHSTAERILAATAEAVAAVYADMCMESGSGFHANRMRRQAALRGYAPPLAWDEGALDDPRSFPRWESVPCMQSDCHVGVEARGLCSTHYRAMYRPKKRNAHSIEERLAIYVDKTPGGCWIWAGARNQYGYGSMRGPDVTVATHRYVYELTRGPVPRDLVLDHLCRVRSCCNPDHLEPVTPQQNVDRGLRAASETCGKGHPMDLIAGARRERRCSTCEREKRRIRTAHERALRDQPDPVVVDRLLAGDMSLARTATTAERRDVVAAWPRSLAELERLTGWRTDRYVEREEGAA